MFDSAIDEGARVVTLADFLRPSLEPDWLHAACRGAANPEEWFPFPSQDFAQARRVCASCPIRLRCLAFAESTEQTGVWGGVKFDRGRRVFRAA